MAPPSVVPQTDTEYKYQRGTYRYIFLIGTLIMSSIFAANVVNVPPTNYPAAFTNSLYVLSPIVLGWIGSFFLFRYRFESALKDGRSFFISCALAFAVILTCYCTSINWDQYSATYYIYILIAVLVALVGIAVLIQVMRSVDMFRVTDDDTWSNFFMQLIIYIPCLIEDFVTYVVQQYGITDKPVIVLFFILVALLILLFYLPTLLRNTIDTQGLLLPNAIPLSLQTTISDSSLMELDIVDKEQSTPGSLAQMKPAYNANYAFSMWVYINKYDTTLRRQHRNIFNYGDTALQGKPCIYIQSDQVYVALSNLDVDNVTIPLQVAPQRWNQIVLNYNGNEADIFLNGDLVDTVSLGGRLPTRSSSDTVVVGDSRGGLSGSICNVSYAAEPMTKVQITSSYNFLRLLNPPMIPGMSLDKPVNEQRNSGSVLTYSYWRNYVADQYNSFFPKFVASVTKPKVDNTPPPKGPPLLG